MLVDIYYVRTTLDRKTVSAGCFVFRCCRCQMTVSAASKHCAFSMTGRTTAPGNHRPRLRGSHSWRVGGGGLCMNPAQLHRHPMLIFWSDTHWHCCVAAHVGVCDPLSCGLRMYFAFWCHASAIKFRRVLLKTTSCYVAATACYPWPQLCGTGVSHCCKLYCAFGKCCSLLAARQNLQYYYFGVWL